MSELSEAQQKRRLRMSKLRNRTALRLSCEQLSINTETAAAILRGVTWITDVHQINDTILEVSYNPRPTLRRIKQNIFNSLHDHLREPA
jgi:hypothetical protein